MARRLLGILASISLAVGYIVLEGSKVGAELRAPVDPLLYAGLHWRSVGPFRGGRSVAVTGVPGDTRTFYFGSVGGGVWQTTNAGTTWKPIMDSQPVASIGAIAVAPSDPHTIYVGSGEADMRSDIVHGNGAYRSIDGGATWTHIGLDDSRQIGRILVDPHDPRTLLVAALGHAYGPNDMRGVFRSTDGGATWTRTLFKDRDTGAIDLAAAPGGSTVYASLWQTRRPPWSVYPPSNGPGSGLYMSRDAGVSWKPLTAGLPAEGLGKIGVAVAPSDPRRVYAIIDAKAGGLYRSDDAGATFRLIDAEKRIWGRGWYFCHVAVDPKNADSVYVSNTSLYHSTDGGTTFTALKGSPDGDDFHSLWIDPGAPERMVLGSDQGTSVSVDGGATWSSWFNQPTGQFYRIAADRAFPYRLFGSQQDNGAAMILSRSSHRGIEERDWRAIGAGSESGSIVPAPHERDVAYGSAGWNGDGVVRDDLVTNQSRTLSQTLGKPGIWRSEWTQPIAFGRDGALYASHQNVFRSRNRGEHWDVVSGDLTRKRTGVLPNLDAPAAADADGPEPRGVVYAIAPSPLRASTVWAGTDDGLVYVTTDDARAWRAVTPPALHAWDHVDAIDASPLDAATAYVAIERHRLDDDTPFVYVTHDLGKTWRESHAGIPDGSFVNVVRADPVRRGLIYAGTETGVYVSFDDGMAWQSLRANMPVVSVRDMTIANGDLAIATHGRAFWILDDIAPLRELSTDPATAVRLFTPRDAVRTREPSDEAEATPPEVVLGENPPNGAFIDYALAAHDVAATSAVGRVDLEIRDSTHRLVRRYASDDVPDVPKPADVDFPAYWILKPTIPAATAGMHRFVWDFHLARSDGPLAAPGRYEVALRTGGRTLVRSFKLLRDPRVAASDADLIAQMQLANAIDAALVAVRARAKAHPKDAASAALRDDLAQLETAVESADAAPTRDERATWQRLRSRVSAACGQCVRVAARGRS